MVFLGLGFWQKLEIGNNIQTLKSCAKNAKERPVSNFEFVCNANVDRMFCITISLFNDLSIYQDASCKKQVLLIRHPINHKNQNIQFMTYSLFIWTKFELKLQIDF